MSTQPYDEEAVFHTARRIDDAAERAAYLGRSCPGPRDRRRIEAMLAVHERDNSFLNAPIQPVPLTTGPGELSERPGMTVGPYKLLEQIGEGGFGVVFMAEQITPVRRKVAVKVIKPGMDTRQVIARFEAERQALALMDHPNIARVLDAGATDSGRPYFVMELVRGVAITDFCDANKLPLEERLALFIDVCGAVQHAHHKGIIHRDLKPSNVLVTLHDSRPVVKIIDFGVAKATGQQLLTDKTLFTNFAQMIGTPLYMSPEQAELSGLDVDTRSDVYALGVLLYELLTGATPFDRDRLRVAGYDEVRRIIREEDPPTPSTRLSSLGATLPGVSAQRRIEPHRLAQRLRGDLDWIVMKTLAKDRTQRYETANALVRDVRRYLADEPVEARPPSPFDRVGKWVRRHKPAVRTAAAVLTLATIIAGALLWQERAQTLTALAQVQVAYQNVEEERQTAEAERARAEANYERARAAVEEMTRLATKDLVDVPGTEQIRHALLEQALAFYQGSLEERSTDPTVQYETGRAHRRLGDIRQLLGDRGEAEGAYLQAAAILEKLAADYPAEAEYRRELGRTWQAMGAVYGPARYRTAEQSFRKALELFETLAAAAPDIVENRENLAHAYYTFGKLLTEFNKFEDAEPVLQRAQRLYEHLTAEFPERLEALSSLALVYSERGSVFVARRHHEWDERFNEGAAENYRRAIEIQETLVADGEGVPVHRYELALNYARLGAVLARNRDRLEEAEQLCRRAQEVFEPLAAAFPRVPRYHSDLAQNDFQLGLVCSSLRHWPDAEAALHQAVTLRERLCRAFPDAAEHKLLLARYYDNLVRVLLKSGRPEDAREVFQQSVSVLDSLDATPEDIVGCRHELAPSYKVLSAAQERRMHAPRNLEPATGPVVTTHPVVLRSSAFDPIDPDLRHVASRWQVRSADATYASPTIDLVSRTELEHTTVSDGMLLPRTVYFWRVAYITFDGMASEYSTETNFVTDDSPMAVVPFDLTANFNADIVRDPGDDENDLVDDQGGVLLQDGFDGSRSGNPQAQGLPPDRRVGVHLLGRYDGPNALQIGWQDDAPIRVEVPRGRYSHIRFLITGGNGFGRIPLTFQYTDGSFQAAVLPFNDWWHDEPPDGPLGSLYPGAAAVLNALDRSWQGKFQDANCAALFEVVLTVDPVRELEAFVLEAGDAVYGGVQVDYVRDAFTRFNLLAATGVRVNP